MSASPFKWKCANCGIPFWWQPTVIDGRVYCCVGCSLGGPCTCDYEHLPTSSERLAMVHFPPQMPPPQTGQGEGELWGI